MATEVHEMLNLIPVGPSTRIVEHSWTPTACYAPPIPPSAAERAAEELKAQQAALLGQESRQDRNQNQGPLRNQGRNRVRVHLYWSSCC